MELWEGAGSQHLSKYFPKSRAQGPCTLSGGGRLVPESHLGLHMAAMLIKVANGIESGLLSIQRRYQIDRSVSRRKALVMKTSDSNSRAAVAAVVAMVLAALNSELIAQHFICYLLIIVYSL